MHARDAFQYLPLFRCVLSYGPSMLMTEWICQRKPFNKDVGSTNFSRRYVPTKAKSTAHGLSIHTKERMYLVDSGTLLHLMGLLSFE